MIRTVVCRLLGARKVDWADEQASRTDEFQQELQAKTKAMSDLKAEKVQTKNGIHRSLRLFLRSIFALQRKYTHTLAFAQNAKASVRSRRHCMGWFGKPFLVIGGGYRQRRV